MRLLIAFVFFLFFSAEKGLLRNIAEKILGFLDYDDLCNAELVSNDWNQVVIKSNLWKELFKRKVL